MFNAFLSFLPLPLWKLIQKAKLLQDIEIALIKMQVEWDATVNSENKNQKSFYERESIRN